LIKKRLDILLEEKGLAKSCTQAQALILAGRVEIRGRTDLKPGSLIPETAPVIVLSNPCPYVSRGGIKLEHALKEFGVCVQDRVALDIGASTGGFTDCLLKHGAQKVYAVDVGRGQLDIHLRKDPRVVVMEKTNARYLDPKNFQPKPSLVVIDVSFISLKKILPIAAAVKEPSSSKGGCFPLPEGAAYPSEIIALIKPQFEAGPSKLKKGVVQDEKTRQEVTEDLKQFAQTLNLQTLQIIPSPIKGSKGNTEYLWHLRCSD